MKRILLVVSCLLISSAAWAEEVIGVVTISGGLICDKPESVIVYIESMATVVPPDCGVLNGSWSATVILTEVHQFSNSLFGLARYEFLGTVPWGNNLQYGFWGSPLPMDATL